MKLRIVEKTDQYGNITFEIERKTHFLFLYCWDNVCSFLHMNISTRNYATLAEASNAVAKIKGIGKETKRVVKNYH